MSKNKPDKVCRHRRCNNPVYGRKQYCSDHCRYWEGVLKHEEEKYLPPKKYRTDEYFSMVTGSRLGGRGQGKRSGGMIMGGMSSVSVSIETIVKVTDDNLKKHFSFDVHTAYLCGGGKITREEWICRTCNRGTPFYGDAPDCDVFYDCGQGDGSENDYWEAIP